MDLQRAEASQKGTTFDFFATASLEASRKALTDAEAFSKDLVQQVKETREKVNERRNETRHLRSVNSTLEKAELVLQLSIVFCSLTILTKRRAYWFIGLVLATLGLLATLGVQVGVFHL